MTLREELELLGPERVRDGMVAFEHRGKLLYSEADDSCPDGLGGGDACCFLHHAFGMICFGTNRPNLIEHAFEGWVNGAPAGPRTFRLRMREELRQECIAFLAEHGTTPEAPASRDAAVTVG